MIQLTTQKAEKYNGFEYQKDCFVNVVYDKDDNPFISEVEAQSIEELKDLKPSAYVPKEYEI